MFRRCLIPMLLLLPLSAVAAVYKWVDAEGNVHYSDLPQSKDAKAVKLPKSSVYSPREIAGQEEEKAETERAAQAVSQIAISQPANDATVRSNQGNVSVSVDLGAPLEDGRYWTLNVDGAQVGDRQSTESVTVQNLPRGQHSLQAQLFDAEGQRLGQSESVVIHLRRESRLAPNKTPNPNPPTSGSSGTPGADAPQFKPNFAPQ